MFVCFSNKSYKITMVNKKAKKELKEKEIENLGEKIKDINKILPEDKKKINRKIFLSMFTSAIVMFVFIFILMGYNNIPFQNYIIDLKVFSIIAIAITICIFEYAYKKDSGSLAIIGIESLIASFIILSLHYVLQYEIYSYKYYLLFFASIFIVYYILKTIIIYIKEKYKYRKSANDIKNIIKKEEI